MAKRDKQIIGGRSYAPPVGIRTKPARGPRRRNSASAGKEKGLLPSPEHKVMAKRSRSYRWKGYSNWAEKYSGKKVVS